MNSVLGDVPASAEGAPQTWAMIYRRAFGLDAQVHPGSGRLFVRAGKNLSAFTMPSALGVRVRGRLVDRTGAAGPIIAHPRSMRWTFLTLPADADPTDPLVHAEMFRHYVDIAGVNAEIALPSPGFLQSDVYRSWTEAPVGDYRPLAGEVLSAVRECVAAQGMR
ncbi:DNA-directed RNA polymerase subunit beta [Nocardia nova]|uniref:DNA-directed RNA polymerase subunit beta n=1 Tax=Nocardia nova TaxID=37330 RepID=A0A2S6AM05_9NOCA|nr:DNA-directed RNA polymerase subunit beta [Nocardia nova]PPJ32606.1 DNA-directed RNA polymerase subunit beta [Nocardia nova]PPJ36249.1 DNA-directed RNA polymerase subunit beta [Nocardia nova]